MQLVADTLVWVLERMRFHLLTPVAVRGYIMVGLILAVTVALEIAARRNWRARYGSKNFRVDTLYYLFYYSGVYHILVFAPLYKFLTRQVSTHAPGLQMNLLVNVPPAVQLLGMLVAADLFGYWIHRLCHANRWLWAFHSIHHSQTNLTVMTNYRFHIVDETVRRLLLFIPFQILGTSLTVWLWADFIMAWVLLVQHSEWNWSYGKFGWLFVSPRFHRMHHSTTEVHQNRNFSMLLTVWDDLFGTAERKAPVPAAHGIEGEEIPETFFGQLVYPFKMLARDFRRRAPAAPVVLPPAAAE